MRTPRDSTPSDGYARPQQAWQCGLSDEGPPCALGPTAWGRCPAAAACHPTRDGDRWLCNRSPLRGGPCAAGPGPDGACAVVHQCTPLRSLRTRRRRFVVGGVVAAAGAALMGLNSAWRNELIVPGPLSAHHAHLVDGVNAALRCAQCHATANASLAAWASLGESSQSKAGATSQSALCMKCHENSLPADFATAAHNMPLEGLRHAFLKASATTAGGSPLRDAAEPIACSTCHREHHGRQHDLAAITDAACQACHQERYHSFADGHPDFGHWPYKRRTRIIFNHASHQSKHYAAEKRSFACADCHEADATGVRQLTRSYEASCASCHDKALAVSSAEGMPLVMLPTLDVAALGEAGVEIAPWPADADGDFDGALPAATQLLLTAKPPAAEALVTLGAGFDFYDVDPSDDKQLAATGVIARELKALVDDLATRGRSAIGERLAAVLGRKLTTAELDALATRLSPDVAAAYRDQWFGDAAASADDGATDQEREPGGWTRHEGTLSLRYLATGHADPWVRAWLDALAEAVTGPRADIAEPLLRAALKSTAPGQCGTCHSVERTPAGRLAIQWKTLHPGSEPRGLTRFAHAPHVLQTQLHDCTTCHQPVAAVAAAPGYSTDNPRQFIAGFEPMSKASCVACHTSYAAGDACTQCHNYHATTASTLHAAAWKPLTNPQPEASSLVSPASRLQPPR